MQKPIAVSKKICMLGSFGVGKTSLVRRFVHNLFQEDYISTVGVQIYAKLLHLPQGKSLHQGNQLNLILWDLAHIEKFNNMVRNYFRGSHGALVVFDVTRSQTFKQSNIYLKPFLEMNPNSKLIFVGNKIDLVKENSIALEQLLQLSNMYHTPLISTSAKTGENVEKTFTQLGNLLVEVE